MNGTKMTFKMMKSHSFDEKKVVYPCYITPKMDGVPAIISKDSCKSRNGEDILSIKHIQKELEPFFEQFPSVTLLGELYIHGEPFKDTSGKARDTKQQHPDLEFHMFDVYDSDSPDLMYSDRIHWAEKHVLDNPSGCVYYARCELVEDFREMEAMHNHFLKRGFEGSMVRNSDGVYKPSKKSWDCMKWKPYLFHDLRVVGFEEAHTIHGVPKGIVGAVLVEYKGNTTKAGAGKLTHAERKEVWENKDKYIDCLAEIKCLKDESYTAMREPTFQRWRFDKDEVSYEK